MDPTPTPHDCFFRENFGRPAIARDFLYHTLPAALLAEVDLATLTIAKDTYVSSELRQVYSDLVYTVRYQQHPKARHLPPVYPLVLYHGQRQWRGAGRVS